MKHHVLYVGIPVHQTLGRWLPKKSSFPRTARSLTPSLLIYPSGELPLPRLRHVGPVLTALASPLAAHVSLWLPSLGGDVLLKFPPGF